MMVNPISVRDGDLLICGGDALSLSEQDQLLESIKAELGISLRLLFIPGCQSAILLRAESARQAPATPLSAS